MTEGAPPSRWLSLIVILSAGKDLLSPERQGRVLAALGMT